MELNLFDVIEQVEHGDWMDLRFTIYNYIVEDGYVTNLSTLLGTKFGIDDLEFNIMPLDEEEVKLIKQNDAETIKWYSNLIFTFEKEAQKEPVCGLFLLKKAGLLFAVKPKGKKIDFSKIFL